MSRRSPNGEPVAAAPAALQARLVQALREPGRYPHPADAVEHIETHISHVLLAGAFAYKIKKPVDLGFLDFSSLEARRFYCEEELRLNRRFARELYLDVVAISGTPDAPLLGGESATDAASGEAIEYALKMRRFPQEALFDRMAEAGTLSARHIDALAAVTARFHDAAARVPEHDPYGRPGAIEAPMRQNFEQLRPLVASEEERATLAAIESWSIAAQARLFALYAERRGEGFVRECHGDLHLRNVAWVNETALPFDCIEFDPNLRWIDVQSEIAFTVMDLYARAQEALALRFLNGYLERSGDYAGLAVFAPYLVYRAMVRAKVARLHAEEAKAEQAGEEALAALARDFALHLRLALRFTAPRPRALVIMHGLSGSGKTVLAEALCGPLDALRVRSDVERKRVAGLDPLGSSGSAVGGDLYSEGATLATYAEVTLAARLILEAGWPVIVDAACLERWQRETFRALARELSVPSVIVSCTAPEAVLRERVTRRKAGGLDASEADVNVLRWQMKNAEALGVDEQPVIEVDTAAEPAERAAARIAAALSGAFSAVPDAAGG